MRKAMISISAAAWLTLAFLLAIQAEDRPNSARTKIMERKLQFSKEILAAVTVEDFSSMATNADGLLELAKTQWIEDETPEYRSQLKDFWIAVEGFKTAAEEKNGDGAALAYVQMTLSCIKCHKYLKKSVN